MTVFEIARVLGRRGGRARARRLSAAQKRTIAALGAQARLHSLKAAEYIAANFRYAEAVRQLGGESTRIKRVHRFTGRLPGIYSNGS